jgi:hypothetical protein
MTTFKEEAKFATMLGTRVPRKVQKVSKGSGILVSTTLVLLGLAFFVGGVIFYTAHRVGLHSHPAKGIDPVGKNNNFAPQTQQNASTSVSTVLVTEAKALTVSKPTLPPTRRPSISAVKSITIADQVALALKMHPIHRLSAENRSHMTLEDHFVYLRDQRECEKIPIFTSMANVFSDMYWQL